MRGGPLWARSLWLRSNSRTGYLLKTGYPAFSARQPVHPPVIAVAEAKEGIILPVILVGWWFGALQNPADYLFVDYEYLPSEVGVSNSIKYNGEDKDGREDEKSQVNRLNSFFLIFT